MRRAWPPCLLLIAALAAACGGDGESEPAAERGDRPVDPPPGWRTVENEQAGFTIAAPESWPARARRGATLIRSDDRLVAVTVAADRSDAGQSTDPAEYVRETILELPEFEGSLEAEPREVRGSPYDSARLDAAGGIETSRGGPQRITVAAFQRAGQVTYSVLVFRNARLTPPLDERIVDRMLRTLRAQPPRMTTRRSGGSGRRAAARVVTARQRSGRSG